MNPTAEYAQRRIQAGLSRGQIRDELLAVGWSEEEADAAYRDGLLLLGIPVPSAADRSARPRPASTVAIVIGFFSFILLGIVASALGTLYFQLINHAIADPVTDLQGLSEMIRTEAIHHATASLLIAFPLYGLSIRWLLQHYGTSEGAAESRLTKWLTYLVLLLASVAILGDLITVLFTLLQGEVTVRFLLKALTILTIAGLIFGFYACERRMVQYHQAIDRRIFIRFGAWVAGIVVVGIALGFVASGSPDTARKRASDQQRARQLGDLARCIERYARELGQLPASLQVLKTTGKFASCSTSMQDAETGAPYEYRITVASRPQGPATVGEFELCAQFALPSSVGGRPGPPEGSDALWLDHPAGRSCDTVTVQLVGQKTAATGP